MLEAICNLRRRLGGVVFLWCPGHSGFSPNEYADMAATAHKGQPIEDVTSVIAPLVTSRDFVYELLSEHSEERHLVDRKCYRMVRRAEARHVHRTLLQGLNTLLYDPTFVDGRHGNHGAGGIATEIREGTVRGKKASREHNVQQMEEEHERVGFAHGVRCRDTCRLPHERGHERRLEAERAGGADLPGGEERCAALGCPAAGCRLDMEGVCEACKGWQGRKEGAAPRCWREGCPGWTARPGEGVTVRGGRGGVVEFEVTRRGRLDKQGQGVSSRELVAQTVAERLRRDRAREHEDVRVWAGSR